MPLDRAIEDRNPNAKFIRDSSSVKRGLYVLFMTIPSSLRYFVVRYVSRDSCGTLNLQLISSIALAKLTSQLDLT